MHRNGSRGSLYYITNPQYVDGEGNLPRRRSLHGRAEVKMLRRMIKWIAVCVGLILASQALLGAEYGKAVLAGHRGESDLAPENTMASFSLAWKNGVKIVETDIHL